VVVGHESTYGHDGFELPFDYYLEHGADLLTLRRSDGSFVAAFNVGRMSLFEIELSVWEDADWRSGHTSPDATKLVPLRQVTGEYSSSHKESRTCYDEHYHKKWVPYRGRSRRKLWLVCFPRRLGPSGAFR